jgi:hypothetical protein
MQRRDFLIRTGRYALMAVLAVVAAVGLKNAGNSPGSQCPLKAPCRECGILQRCGLPGALEERSGPDKENNN